MTIGEKELPKSSAERSILYLFNYSQAHELASYRAGRVPGHRLFGFADLEKRGHRMWLCPGSRFLVGPFKRDVFWRFHQAFFAWRNRRKIDCIVATHEANALPVLLLKRLRLLKTPIVVVNVSMLQPKNLTRKRRWFWRWLLPAAELILSYCSFQIPWIQTEFALKTERLAFFPLGVDTEFFTTNASAENEFTAAKPEHRESAAPGFCLSVGSNYGKDFETLLAALPHGIRLVIVTDETSARHAASLVKPDQKVEISTAVPIEKLRELYRNATLMVIPLHDMRVSLGQTVLLENMAMGKIVLISDTSSVRDYIEPNVSALAVPPYDADAMRACIERVFAAPESFAHIGIQAAQKVRQQFSSQQFADQLLRHIEKLVAR